MMSHVYVTSDWHIGHTGITERFRTQFPSDAYHDDYILENMREAVTNRDVLYVIGDVTWTKSGLEKIQEADIPAKMIMVRGNHDTLPAEDYLTVFDDVHGAYKYKRYMFTHIPIHRQELWHSQKYDTSLLNVHGHCHRGGPWEVNKEWEYFNAILEYNNYMPVNMQKVGELIQERKDA